MPDFSDPFLLAAISLIGLGLIGVAALLWAESNKREKSLNRINALVEARRRVQNLGTAGSAPETSGLTGTLDTLGQKLSQSSFLKLLVEDEDAKLLGKAGFGGEDHLNRYALLRVGGLLAGVAIWFFLHEPGMPLSASLIRLIAGIGLCFMGPKWILRGIANSREAAFNKELSTTVDIMRLLQGVGLSTEQAIEVMAIQLSDLIPITGSILSKGTIQVQTGASWLQVFRNISKIYDHPEFKSFIAVINQIDKFGGSVQEPLRQFSDRLIEKERAGIKENMGKLAVRISGIMVLTMMPAFLIVAAGPGFISLSRAF